MTNIYITLYKVTWCGYCKRFEPNWEKFVNILESKNIKDKLQKQNITIIFDKYDGDENKDVISRSNIKYYPTVRVSIKNSKDNDQTYDLEDHERELNAFADKIFSNNLITSELLDEIKSNFPKQSGGFFDYATKPKLKYYNQYLKYKQRYLSLKNK